jgi:hypothetical protein
VAEDITASRCKRGHLRIPENLYAGGTCKPCKTAYYLEHREALLAARAIYEATPQGQANRRRYQASPRYRAQHAAWNASTKGWEAQRRWRLKGQREIIQAKLESLKKEEEEACRKLAALLIATK